MTKATNESTRSNPEVRIELVQGQEDQYRIAVESTSTDAAMWAMQFSTDGAGLRSMRAAIDGQLNQAIKPKRDAKDHQAIKLRNCVFAYRCTMTWDDLELIPDAESTRHCPECNKLVTLCRTDEELLWAIRENLCVAIKTDEPDNQPMPLGMPKAIDWIEP